MIIGVTLFFLGCSEDFAPSPDLNEGDLPAGSLKSAAKPAPNLKGTTVLDFMGVNPVWVGTITLEGLGDYGMRFYHLSPMKGYSQASPFEEYFEIYDPNDPDHVYLAGHDEGVTVLANKPPDPCKYRMTGSIEVANEPFEGWLGRNVFMSGVINWEVESTPDGPAVIPDEAVGIFRIN